MARVNQDVKMEAENMIDQLPEEVLKTCGLCNRTLFDQLMVISSKTGVPQMTVCNIFADRYNQHKRDEDKVSAKAFRDRMQYISRMNLKELSAESQQISNESCTTSETDDESADEISELQQDTNTETIAPEEPGETVATESSLNHTTERDPYDVIVELWRDKQYSAEDAYEVFLTELLGRFKPDEVDQYRHNAGVKLDDLGMIIGKTVRQNDGLSPEDLHQVLRGGLETFGGWKRYRTDKAIGTIPLTPEQRAAGDF